MEKIFLGRDLLAILPTGYGKSMIFHVLPALLYWKKRLDDSCRQVENSLSDAVTVTSNVIVVSPLNSLISNQISRLTSTGQEFGARASVLNVKNGAVQEDGSVQIMCDLNEFCEFSLCCSCGESKLVPISFSSLKI